MEVSWWRRKKSLLSIHPPEEEKNRSQGVRKRRRKEVWKKREAARLHFFSFLFPSFRLKISLRLLSPHPTDRPSDHSTEERGKRRRGRESHGSPLLSVVWEGEERCWLGLWAVSPGGRGRGNLKKACSPFPPPQKSTHLDDCENIKKFCFLSALRTTGF